MNSATLVQKLWSAYTMVPSFMKHKKSPRRSGAIERSRGMALCRPLT